MLFEKHEKVIVLHKSSPLYGRMGRVCFETGDQSVKLEIPGTGYCWFSANLLRKVKRNAQFRKIDEGEPVEVVDIKGNYERRDFIGKYGIVDWVEDNSIIVKFGENEDGYFEMGDLRKIPERKKAWVIYPDQIRRVTVKFVRCTNGQGIWSDEKALYLFNDSYVFDKLTPALEKERKNNKETIKVTA